MVILILAICVSLLSSYIRHTEAGLGCNEWPACYAQIDTQFMSTSENQIGQEVLIPTQKVKRLHRVLAIAVMFMTILLLRAQKKVTAPDRPGRSLPGMLLLIVILLAVIGPFSYLKTWPAIATINLLGGMALLSLSWWLWLQLKYSQQLSTPTALYWLARISLVATIFVVASGAWVSANFAAVSCTGIVNCIPSDRVVSGLSDGAGVMRELNIDSSGYVIIDQSMELIYKAHRMVAVILAILLASLGAIAIREGGQYFRAGLLIIILISLELLFGVMSVLWQLPITLVVGHNLLATLLLMSVIYLNSILRRTS